MVILVLMNIVNSIVMLRDLNNGCRRVIRTLWVPIPRLIGRGKETYPSRLTLYIEIKEPSS